jgi:phage-related protein
VTGSAKLDLQFEKAASMSPKDKPLVWLTKTVTTPPFSSEARIKAGYLLRKLQQGEILGPPDAKKLADLCPKCYELRIKDRDKWYRIMVRIDSDAIVILGWFEKKSNRIPKKVLEACGKRMRDYDF